MQMGLNYSFKKLIDDQSDYDAIIYYDGIELSGKDNPFVLIKPGTNVNRTLSKRKETVAVDYKYDLEIRASSMRERSEMQRDIGNLVLFSDITLYDDDGEDTGKVFEADITSEVPLYPEELNKDSDKFRLYLETEVTDTKNRRNS